jgi:ABC-type transporter Mla subunit MlaD
VDNNSKALIEALREVIRDFNTKISEQFGDNFKQLNVAVGQLLVWQESYRLQLTEMIEQQSTAAQNMQVATDGFREVMEKADTFSVVSAQLSDLLTTLNDQRSQIAASIEALGHLLNTASGSLPEIESKIVELTTQMTQGVRQNQVDIAKTLKDSAVMLEETIGDTKKLLLDATQTTNQEVNAHFKQLGERTSEQISKLDVALEKELTRALTTLASQLTSLSAQFVSDYGPLTANLRDIVQSARR